MKEYIEGLNEEILNFVSQNSIDQEELYDVVRKYAEILINSVPFKDGQNMSAVFPYAETDLFVDAFKLLSDKRIIFGEEREKLFKIVNDTYKQVITDDEKAAMPSGFIPVEDYHSNRMGHCGNFYSCDYIPDEVVESIKEEALTK